MGDELPQKHESIGDLLRRLIDDVVNLVRSELALARSEVSVSIRAAFGSLAAVAVGAMLAMVATSCLLVATIAWLSERVGLVAAALIVAAVLGLAAVVLVASGVSKLQQMDLAPRRTAANLKRTAEMMKGD